MAIENGGFEVAGATPGLAQGWTASFVSSLESYADFDQNPGDAGATSSQEAFERGWTDPEDQEFVVAFDGVGFDLEAAIFNVGPGQQSVERFEANWGGSSFIAAHTTGYVATFSGLDQERFDSGWGSIEYQLGLANAAVFGTGVVETFEAGWKSNDGFSDELSSFDTDAALFAGEEHEGFEDVIAPASITIDAATDTMTLDDAAAVALANDQRVQFVNRGGELPSPIGTAFYFLVNVSGLQFQIASSAGNAPLALDSYGTGVTYLIRDQALWWSRIMTTV